MATSGEASTVAATEMASSDEAPMMDLSDQNGGGKNGEQRQHSTNGTAVGEMLPPSPVPRDQLHKRIDSLMQQNRVLKVELETFKLRVKALQEENRALRLASVHIQAKAEQEEEFISNTLLKKIQELKKEKENLALNYEQEEECLTNDLSRKLDQLRHEKVRLEHTLEQEQECLVNKLMRRIEKLETETTSKQHSLDSLRREKVELENTLEQEQEALVNKLWKKMDQLENEKRTLQKKLEKPEGDTPPRVLPDFDKGGDTAAFLANNIRALKAECMRLKKQLAVGQQEHERRMAAYAKEEREIREENLRLQRRLQLEMERREALCRHLSESESSLEMEEERHYNEMTHHQILPPQCLAAGAHTSHRSRTVSSPVPLGMAGSAGLVQSTSSNAGRPLSPGILYVDRREVAPVVVARPDVFTPPSKGRLHHSFNSPPAVNMVVSPSPPPAQHASAASRRNVVRTPLLTNSEANQPQAAPLNIPQPDGPQTHANPVRRLDSTESKPPASPMDTSDTKA